jgi:NAD-dependent deacetylase
VASQDKNRYEDPDFRRVVTELRKAQHILVLTGAGVSAESNIPTFRGKNGWWRSMNPEELATLAAFKRNPQLVWEWYDYRRRLIAEAVPNAAHRVLADLESPRTDVFIITQNVDDLHERAGSSHVVHIHGSIWTVTCFNEGNSYQDRRVPLPELPPLCPCGGILRPGVVWFDEDLPSDACAEIEEYFNNTKIDVVLVVGTEATFDYIRDWALSAKHSGALLVEINPGLTALSDYADVRLKGNAGVILGEMQRQLSMSPRV